MKKGFTLIELLAVIIILSVIALITTPIVLDVVENAKEKSRISSVNSLLDATRLYMTEALLDDSIDLSGNLLDIINNRVKGTKPTEGEIKINGNDIGIAVKIDGICYSKYYTSDEIRKTNDEDCFIALEASDYVMTALVAVINYEECVTNLNGVLEASYTEEELDKICKNELELENEITLKEIILAYYVYENQEYISLFEETNIAKIDYIKEKGYEKCFEYETSNIINDFDINYDLCMEIFDDENICKGEKVDLLGNGNLITLKEYILSSSEIQEEAIGINLIENIKYDEAITITNYLCSASNDFILNKNGLPVVSDVVIPTTINGMKVVEIAGANYNNETTLSFSYRGLTSVDFTYARYLEKIGERAFMQNFYRISEDYIIKGEIDLSNTKVTSIGDFAFYNNLITSIKLSDSITSIGEDAFNANRITSLKLSDSIVYIGSGAFNANLLPDEEAFIYKRTDLNNDGIAEIDDSVLISYGGVNITDVVFPSNIKEIDVSFDGWEQCDRFDGVLDLSQTSIKEIKSQTFYYVGITGVKLPNTIEKIGYMAFYGNQITSVKMPNSVTKIDSDAFEGNSNLTLIEIDNTKDAIEGSPWGASGAEIKWLRDSE